jgi:hypothetical protein
MFTADEMKDALILHANNFKSCFIRNSGAGKFEMFHCLQWRNWGR